MKLGFTMSTLLSIYIDAQSVRSVEDALWSSKKELFEILMELASSVGGPVGRL